jgi:hypothetical protein
MANQFIRSAFVVVEKDKAPVRRAQVRNNATELTEDHRKALASIADSGLFTLKKSAGMYSGIKSLRPVK